MLTKIKIGMRFELRIRFWGLKYSSIKYLKWKSYIFILISKSNCSQPNMPSMQSHLKTPKQSQVLKSSGNACDHFGGSRVGSQWTSTSLIAPIIQAFIWLDSLHGMNRGAPFKWNQMRRIHPIVSWSYLSMPWQIRQLLMTVVAES